MAQHIVDQTHPRPHCYPLRTPLAPLDSPVSPDLPVPSSNDAPLWDGYCADPFVLRTPEGRYVMYGTTPEPLPEGRIFQTLVSEDLLAWEPVGGALVVPHEVSPGTQWWAPEVAYEAGRYWMYYSTGIGDSGHQLRVATAAEATGPFHDTGHVLTPGISFAIDPSPFRDEDGTWWLFFATDVVEGERPGTVLAVQRLEGMTRLQGPLRVILRASADWQRYESGRSIYGAEHDWHTLEGPTVAWRAGRYWMLYSGGNWQTAGYGVAAASARSVDGPWSDSSTGPIISTATSGLIGPGHCSILAGDDGLDHLFLHAWDPQSRRRRPHRLTLDLTGPRPLVVS